MGLSEVIGLSRRAFGLFNRNRSAVAALAMRGAGVVAGFALTFLIARWFGPEANGVYAVITQSAIFLSVVAVGGLDLAIVREFSRAVALRRPVARRAIIGVLVQTAVLALALGGAIFAFESIILPRLVGNSPIAFAGPILALLILLRALMRILAAILRSQSHFSTAQAIELFLLPIVTILLLLTWPIGDQQIGTVLVVSTIASGLVVMVGVVLVFRESDSGPHAVTISQKNLFLGALPMWGMAIAQNLADWFALVSVNEGSGTAEAGIFRVGWQISSMLSILSLSLLSTFSTQIATAVHNNKQSEVARQSRTATRMALLIFAPLSIAIIVFADPLMHLFGPEFKKGASTLRALTVGQFALAGFGIVGQVMIMVGHARLNLLVSVACAVLVLTLAPFAAEWSGGAGVAMLISAVNILKIISFFAIVRRLEGYNAFSGKIYHSKPA